MATLSPIAPPQNIATPPVTEVVVAEQPAIKSEDPAVEFDAAVSNRDPVGMIGIAKKSFGTPVAEAALKAADVMYKTSKEFDAFANPIIKKGGALTPEGRLEVAQKFETIKENPRYKDALFLLLTGDQAGARRMIMGGAVKRQITYDNAGRPIEEYVNELGEQERVRDPITGRDLTPEEYFKRGGGRPTLENTLGFQTRKANLEANRLAYKETEKQSNAYASASAEIKTLNQQRINLVKNLNDLPDEVRTKAFEFANESFSKGQEVSKSIDTLKQLTAQNGIRVGEQIDKRLSASFGPGVWKYEGSGRFTNERGESRNIQDLDQKTEADRVANEIKNSFNRTREDLIKFELYKRMSPEQKLRLDQFINISNELATKNAELAAGFGTPTYLVTPSAFNITDQLARGEIQSIQGEFNAEASQLFDVYRKQMIQNYGPDDAPSPKELEANFVKTPEYRKLREDFKKRTDDVLDRGPNLAPSETPKKEAKAPPAVETTNAPARSKPPKEEPRKPNLDELLEKRRIKKPTER